MHAFKSTGLGLTVTLTAAAAGYALRVVRNRARYATAKASAAAGKDTLLDRFVPAPEVVQHHAIAINAPADVIMAAAKEIEPLKSPLVRALFKIRQMALGGDGDIGRHPPKLLAQAQSMGWVALSERAGREIVLGSVTQPWLGRPRFRSICAADFPSFKEPGFAKIAWTLRADPIDGEHCIFHTETRVCTTDPEARRLFRNYWSFVEPGVDLVRLAMLRPLKRAAERRYRRHAGDGYTWASRWPNALISNYRRIAR